MDDTEKAIVNKTMSENQRTQIDTFKSQVEEMMTQIQISAQRNEIIQEHQPQSSAPTSVQRVKNGKGMTVKINSLKYYILLKRNF